jgi:hypothetical protein
MDIWRWNYARAGLQAEFGDARFVPRIVFMNFAGKVSSAAVWTDGIPAIIPEVDVLILVRKGLASDSSKKNGDRALLAWKRARPVLERYGSKTAGNSIVLDYDMEPPRKLSAFIGSLTSRADELQFFRPEEVLERELVEKYAPKSIAERILGMVNWKRSES